MSAESRNQAVAGFVAAVQEALDAFRSTPDGAPGFPASGARKYLGDVAPNAALLLEGLGGGASRCVVRIGAPFVLHVELPELTPAPTASAIDVQCAEAPAPVVPAAPSKRAPKRGA